MDRRLVAPESAFSGFIEEQERRLDAARRRMRWQGGSREAEGPTNVETTYPWPDLTLVDVTLDPGVWYLLGHSIFGFLSSSPTFAPGGTATLIIEGSIQGVMVSVSMEPIFYTSQATWRRTAYIDEVVELEQAETFTLKAAFSTGVAARSLRVSSPVISAVPT